MSEAGIVAGRRERTAQMIRPAELMTAGKAADAGAVRVARRRRREPDRAYWQCASSELRSSATYIGPTDRRRLHVLVLLPAPPTARGTETPTRVNLPHDSAISSQPCVCSGEMDPSLKGDP